MRPALFLIVILALASLLPAAELVTNGAFEEPARVGWTWDTFGLFNDTGNCHLWQSAYYDSDLDKEVCVHKVLHQWAMLSQAIPVTDLNLNFSAAAKLFAKTERPDTGFYAAANVVLSYLDENDTILGETRICTRTGGCDWVDSPTLHLIDAIDSTSWHNYAFNVGAELDNLSGVNRAQIRKIRIGLLSYVRNNC